MKKWTPRDWLEQLREDVHLIAAGAAELKESDANSGATYTVTADATGKQVATFTGSSASPVPAVRTFTVPSVPPNRAVTVTGSLDDLCQGVGLRA